MLRSEYPPNLKMPIARMDSSKAAAILELLKEPGNDVCADCGAALATDNAWAVLSYGILVCDDCKLVHIEHENHYAASEPNSSTTDISLKGILSTQIPQLWEDKDIAQIRANGNKRTNIRLLANSPVWQYRPSGNDGIKLKEYWIKCKYSGNAGDAAENPKIAAKKQFIGIQFIRPNPKGNYPCCVVLQNDTLYLTSDIRNEEVPVECVETIVVNSKRIGHENGVQLTYRINNDGNTVAFTYLQHENMETVMDWVSLVLYTKYNLLKRKYPTMIDVNVAKILNCGMVKESYIHVSGRGLIYLSLSEARLSCFQHHLEDKPLFQIAVSEVMNLTATQYLDAVACFFDIDASKIQSYADWVAVLEQVLKTDKISAMPDDVPKPSFPFSLLKKQTEKPPPAPAPVPERNNPTPPTNQNHVVKVAPIPTPATTAPPVTTPQQHAPTTQITNGDKEGDKKPNNYECYPPIGPMGEMGKVFRGELPPEAIKPPPSKNDIARLGVFGDYVPGQALPNVAQLQPIKADGFGDLTNPALSSYPTSLNSAVANGIINQGLTKDSTCYPPIGGPAQAMKLRYAEISAAVQMAREQELEEMRNGSLMFRSTTLAQKHAMFDQTRLQSNPAFARGFSESDASTFTQAAMPPPNFQGWGDSGTDNLLTMPWKQTVNGFEATRGFNSSSYPERLAWQKLQAATMERKLSGQENKNLASFGTWGARPQSSEQASASISHVPNAWGTSINAGGMSHWGSKSPTNPLDSFALGRDGRAAPPGITREFSNPGSVTRGFINPKLPSRSDSTSTSPPGVSSQQQMIIENLLRMWKSAEQRLLSLIHNGYVPASDMSPAGLDKDSAEHAYTCVSELFELLWKQRYDLALSFLRGFREVFANSVHPEIRNLFIGVGELDTMKQIFLQQGKEKFLSGSSGGPVTWKQPTPPPSQIEHSWPATTPSLPTVPARESPTDFLPWSPFSPTTDAASLWSGASTSGVTSMRTPSLSSDPWSTSNSIFSSTTSTSVTGPSFNRAPSRPVTHARSSFGDNSPTDGSFGSKASSNSTSPRVVTPPTGFEPSMNSTSLAGIESTLKYIFLNSND